MKIGIITQPLHNNYGGLLQNFALQKLLIDNGHMPLTLDWEPKPVPHWKIEISKLKHLVLSKIKSNYTIPNFIYEPSKKEASIISKNTSSFISKYINRTKKNHFSYELKKETEINKLDIIIVGSDQVWRPLYSSIGITNMFVGFLEHCMNVKRIAYAASFGTDEWEFSPEDTFFCSNLAKKFSLITVREESGVKLCKEHLNVDAIHVLDPTMLQSKNVYEKIVEDSNTSKSRGSLFYYILDPSDDKTSFIDSLGNDKGLIPFTVMPTYQVENRTKKNVRKEIEKCIFPGVEEWLRAFIDAELIVCDSFHGCVFSIIFNKPFWVIGNKERGNARFDSLLNMFGLQDRLISSNGIQDINKPIDWGRVNYILNEKRQYSIDLLLNSLK